MKKIITLALTVLLLSTSVVTYAGSSSGMINFQKAQNQLIQNSSALKNISYNEYKTKNQYDDLMKALDNFSISEVKRMKSLYLHTTLDSYDEMQMVKYRDYTPVQLKYYITLAQNTRAVTEKQLVAGLRDLYMGVANAGYDLKVKQDKLALEKKKNAADKVKFAQGMISEQDLDLSNYTLEKAGKDVDAAVRNSQNMLRTLNNFIGAPVNATYDRIVFEEQQRTEKLKPLNDYIQSGLKNRWDITNLQKQLELDQLDMQILRQNNVYPNYRKARIEYDNTKRDMDGLNVKLEQTKLSIESEIKSAYIDLNNQNNSIISLKKNLDSQKRMLEKLKVQYKAGLIVDTVIDEVQIGIEQLENGLKLSVYSYNTKLMKLENAAGIGPGMN